jgi:hypothetical protein
LARAAGRALERLAGARLAAALRAGAAFVERARAPLLLEPPERVLRFVDIASTTT